MNILFLTEDFPPMPGGIAMFLSELCKGLTRRGHEIKVLAHEMPDSDQYDLKQPYSIIRYPVPGRLSSVRIGYQILRQIIKKKPDVLFLGHVMATRGFPVLLFKWGFRMPYVVLCHSDDLRIADVSKINRISTYSLMRNADLILANSEFTRRLLIRSSFLGEKIKILNPGVDTNLFFPSNDQTMIRKTRLKYNADEIPLVISVGRLVPRKNHEGLIRAIADLRDQGILVKCIIVGGGPEKVNLERSIERLRLERHVSLMGHTSFKRLRELYQVADVVTLPSIAYKGSYEGFGIVALEASACGKPVIVGSEGGQSESVIPDKTGIIVDAEDHSNIAKAIAYLIDREDVRDQMSNAGRAYAVEKFSWIKIAQRAATLLSKVK